jgi:urease accessory protein
MSPTAPQPIEPETLTTLLLADGRFPTGGHAQSAGVEAAVHIGDVLDLPTLVRYLRGRLATTGVTDAAFAVATVAALARSGDDEIEAALVELDEEYQARVLSPQLAAASRRFGRQVLRTSRRAWSGPAFAVLGAFPDGPHQPIALGATVAAAGGGHRSAATLVMHHIAGAVGSAGVRLLGLDPIAVAAAQAAEARFMAELLRPVDEWAVSSPATLPALGGTLTEILAEDHGTWEARLFVA